MPPIPVSEAGTSSALFDFGKGSKSPPRPFSPVYFRNPVITILPPFPLFLAAESPPPWESFDLLQAPFQPENKNYIKQNEPSYPKGACHNLIKRSTNKTPPDTSAIQTRLLAFRETHCL